jgi:hypothetical protein
VAKIMMIPFSVVADHQTNIIARARNQALGRRAGDQIHRITAKQTAPRLICINSMSRKNEILA